MSSNAQDDAFARQTQAQPPSPPGQSSSASAGHAAAGGGTTGTGRGAEAMSPVMRNVLRYTVSAREYAALHRYLLSRSRVLRRAAPAPSVVAASSSSSAAAAAASPPLSNEYNVKVVRHALRVFMMTWLGIGGYEVIMDKIFKKRKPLSNPIPFYKSPALRLSLSLSSVLVLYRLLFRFLARLRAHLLDRSVEPFRRRNPRVAAALTSTYAPAVGASLAGLALGIYPSSSSSAARSAATPERAVIAVWLLSKALESAWEFCEGEGLVWGFHGGGSSGSGSGSKNGNGNGKAGGGGGGGHDEDGGGGGGGVRRKRPRPSWFGSWLLLPFAFGQLLHASVVDRDCFPEDFGRFIWNSSPVYLHRRPVDYPEHLEWPSREEVVGSLGEMARLNWPAYVSPTMFPNKPVLPPSLAAISPLTARAHPLIGSLSCAALHPSSPSCLLAFFTFWLRAVPPLARFFLAFHAAAAALAPLLLLLSGGGSGRLRHRQSILALLRRVGDRAARSTLFVAGSLSTAWASICLFQAVLPRHFLASERFFLSGFAAGLWAWMFGGAGKKKLGGGGSGGAAGAQGRPVALYVARASVHSLFAVGVKRRWWRAVRGGDLGVVVLALLVTGAVYERDPAAIRDKSLRKGVSWIRGEGWRDWAAMEEEEEGGEEKRRVE